MNCQPKDTATRRHTTRPYLLSLIAFQANIYRQQIRWMLFAMAAGLSLSSVASEPDRQLCVGALSEVNQYVEANRELAAARVNDGVMSIDAYEQLLIEYDDIEASVSMPQCIAGNHTALYQCLVDNNGRYDVCR